MAQVQILRGAWITNSNESNNFYGGYDISDTVTEVIARYESSI